MPGATSSRVMCTVPNGGVALPLSTRNTAHMNLLLAAVKVLVSDLIDSGYLIHQQPRPATAKPDIKLLQAVLDGVRKL